MHLPIPRFNVPVLEPLFSELISLDSFELLAGLDEFYLKKFNESKLIWSQILRSVEIHMHNVRYVKFDVWYYQGDRFLYLFNLL